MLKKIPNTKIFYCQFNGSNVAEVQMLATAICSERKCMSLSIEKQSDGLVIDDFRLILTDRNNQKLKPGDYFVQEGKQWRIVPESEFVADENVIGVNHVQKEVNWI